MTTDHTNRRSAPLPTALCWIAASTFFAGSAQTQEQQNPTLRPDFSQASTAIQARLEASVAELNT